MSFPRYRLQVTPAEGQAFEHLLLEDSLVIGRSIDAGLNLADPFLSRSHSRLFRQDGRLLIEDLGSRNGTLVNGAPIGRPTELRPGDSIQLSGSTLRLLPPLEAGRGDGIPVAAPEGDDLEREVGGRTVLFKASDILGRQQVAPPAADTTTGELRRYAERLRLLNDVHQALGRSIAIPELLELILDGVFDHLQPDRGVILLRDGDQGLTVAARRSRSVFDLRNPTATSGTELAFSRSLAREVIDKGMAALVLDVQADERFARAESLLLSGIRSVIAAPLLDPDGTYGLIALESKRLDRTFQEEDLELLASLASVAALHLRSARLAEAVAERKRLEEELALARRIQIALLPSTLPDLPGWELHSGNIPSRGVSGDYFEVIERKGGAEVVLILADVSGKGMAASLLTASLQAFSAGPIEDGLPVDEIAVRLSRLLYRRTPPEKYATAFLGTLEPATGLLRYTNAGHNPPLVVRADGRFETLPPTGVPIGLLPMAPYQSREVTLEPGDRLVLYTDGIVEAFDPDGEEYGEERLTALCVSYRGRAGVDLALALERELEGFVRGVPFADDRTQLLVRRLPA